MGAKEGQEVEVEKMENASWRFTTTREAYDKLAKDDVSVTNARDKEEPEKTGATRGLSKKHQHQWATNRAARKKREAQGRGETGDRSTSCEPITQKLR